MLYADKEKALDYLSSSAPIADATSNQELSYATNIVKEFGNPAVDGENVRYRQRRAVDDKESAPETASVSKKKHQPTVVSSADGAKILNNLGKVVEEEATEVHYRRGVNERFNEELERQIDGELLKRHVYSPGRPSVVLLAVGIPDLPIELAASRLELKASI